MWLYSTQNEVFNLTNALIKFQIIFKVVGILKYSVPTC